MSLINQMLNDLERRGAGELPTGEPVVRAVPQAPQPRRGGRHWLWVLLASAGAAGWYGYTTRLLPNPPDVSPALPVAQLAASAPLAVAPESVPKPVPKPRLVAQPVTPPQSPVQTRPTVPKPVVQPVANESVIAASAVAVPLKQVTPQQQADHEFRQALAAAKQGRTAEAVAGYETALRLDATHDEARWALAGWLIETKRHEDADQLLHEGLKLHPRHTGFAMLRARLQVERNELTQALETLTASLPYVGQQADYRAFMAAVLQRLNRHDEAVAHYRVALQQMPESAVWRMGEGISLQATQRNAEALESFRRAAVARTLSPELQAFVERRISDLSR